MLTRPLRHQAGILLLMLAGALSAQVPESILAARFRIVRQTDSSTQEPGGAAFLVRVAFPKAPPAGTSVRLRNPEGATNSLRRSGDGTFEISFEVADLTPLTRFPDGAYSIEVSGGTEESSTIFPVITGEPPSPVLIANFDALQSWPNPTPEVSWEVIPGVSTDDQFGFSISSLDGSYLFETRLAAFNGAFAVTGTFCPTQLPLAVPLRGELAYYRISTSRINGGGTTLGIAGGFVVNFPLTCAIAAPRFTEQPQSQLGNLGGTVVLDATASGYGNQSYQFQLKRNGTVLGGVYPEVSFGGSTHVTYRIPIERLSDAGSYTIEVKYADQIVSSDPAVIVVPPRLKLADFAGSGVYGVVDGPAALAQFENPMSLAVDATGNLVVADQLAFSIRSVSTTGFVSTIAGTPERRGAADGPGAAARFSDPAAVAIDPSGHVYVADSGNGTIRRISPAGAVTTLAGLAGSYGTADGAGSKARFQNPNGVAVDTAGNVYVSDTGNHTIRRITPDGMVSTLAGLAGAPGSTDGSGPEARFRFPLRSKFEAGYLYVGDQNGLRRVSPSGLVTTVPGAAADASSTTSVQDVAIDAGGTIYTVTPSGIRRLVAGVSTTVATGEYSGIAIDAVGNVYVTESRRYRVHRGQMTGGSSEPGITVITSPRSQIVAAGESVLLQVQASGPGVHYQWKANGEPIPGATTSVLLAHGTGLAGQIAYSVEIGNGVGFASPAAAPAQIVFSTTSDPGRIGNLSIRSTAGTAAQTLIAGIVLGGGTPGAGRPFLIRGVGPTLESFGVFRALADPVITLNGASGATLSFNDDWGGGRTLADAFAAAGAFPLPSASRDAAISVTLVNGAYTVGVSGKNGAAGVGLAEIYELPVTLVPGNRPRIVNLSARTQVGAGGNVLIAGFTVAGSTSKTLLIRGVGPTLASFGVTGALSDPRLQVFKGSVLVASSDNWRSGADADMGAVAAQAAQQAGAFPLGSAADAALVATLPPGSYTVQVSGVGGATGVALVEIYEVP